jgi:hypothetical protein
MFEKKLEENYCKYEEQLKSYCNFQMKDNGNSTGTSSKMIGEISTD